MDEWMGGLIDRSASRVVFFYCAIKRLTENEKVTYKCEDNF